MALDATVGGASSNSKPCASCGASVPAVGNRKYCASCMTRKCEQCGVEFRALQVTAGGRFCSHSCYSASLEGAEPWNKGKKMIRRKICKNCGRRYRANKKTQLTCSAKCKAAWSSGEGHYNWKGGVNRYSDRREYMWWRKEVLVRDGGRCRWCDSEGVRNYSDLHVHHIVPYADSPELGTDVANGIALCAEHHHKTLGRECQYAEFFAGLIGEELKAPPAPNRKDRAPMVATREQLEDAYLLHEMSTPEIGKALGVTGACVLKHLKRMSIPVRSAREAGYLARHHHIGNKHAAGKTPWNKGKTGVYSEHTLESIRRARANQESPMKGRKMSQESRDKISRSKLGSTPWNKGVLGVVSHSEEAKRKISEASKRMWKTRAR